MKEASGSFVFTCTPAGQIAVGRQWLRTLLLGVAALMVLLAIGVAIAGRTVPGLLALAAAGLSWFAWRTGSELDLQGLVIEPGAMILRLKSQDVTVPLRGLQQRRLDASDIAHLEQLTSLGPFAAGSGGFDSHRLGEFDLYATDLSNAVWVATEEMTTVLTPDEPDSFLAAVRQHALD